MELMLAGAALGFSAILLRSTIAICLIAAAIPIVWITSFATAASVSVVGLLAAVLGFNSSLGISLVALIILSSTQQARI